MRFKKNLMHQRKKSVRAQIEIRAFTDQYLSVNGFFPCMRLYPAKIYIRLVNYKFTEYH